MYYKRKGSFVRASHTVIDLLFKLSNAALSQRTKLSVKPYKNRIQPDKLKNLLIARGLSRYLASLTSNK